MLTQLMLCATATIVALKVLEQQAARIGLVENPGGHRTHLTPTPVVGGLAMAFGLFLTWTLWDAVHPGPWIATGAGGLVALGFVDDRHGVRARNKFAAQAAIAAMALVLDGSVLLSLGELLPDRDVRLMAALAVPFSVFAVLGLINGVNMLDGLDGLAGKVVLVALGWFALCAWRMGAVAQLGGTLAIAAVVAAFLLFNARLPGRLRARLFMGDAGSMLLGFLLAWIAIDLSQRPHGLPPVTALWICALPILDTFAVMTKRYRKRRHLMSAGRDHLHHLLRRRGLSVASTAVAEATIGAFAGLIGVTGWVYDAPDWLMLLLFVVFASAYIHLFLAAWKDLQAREARSAAPSVLSDLPL